jgi:hypothetical protein
VALNGVAVRTGTIAALPVVLPAALANAWLAGRTDPNPGLVLLTYLALLVGFTFGGFAAARVSAEGTPLQHGAAGAVGAWAVVELLALTVRLARGDGINLIGMVFTALLAASAGVVGGILSTRAKELRP